MQKKLTKKTSINFALKWVTLGNVDKCQNVSGKSEALLLLIHATEALTVILKDNVWGCQCQYTHG